MMVKRNGDHRRKQAKSNEKAIIPHGIDDVKDLRAGIIAGVGNHVL